MFSGKHFWNWGLKEDLRRPEKGQNSLQMEGLNSSLYSELRWKNKSRVMSLAFISADKFTKLNLHEVRYMNYFILDPPRQNF